MSKELIVLEDVKIEPFFIGGKGIDSILAEIEVRALEHVPDVSTDKGRKAIKANITKITTCKTFLEASGKELSAARKLEPKLIDSNRKRVKEFLEALQVTARLKLTEWEAEQARIKLEAEEKEAADARIALHDTYYEVAAILMAEDFRQREAAAEQARLDQIAHDEAIAAKAKEDAELAAKAEIEQAEADKQWAILAAKEAEEKAEQDKVDSANREKQAKIDEASRAKLAAEKAEADKQAAIKAEQQRVADELAKVVQDAADREADTEHKKAVNNAIMDAIIEHTGVTKETAVLMLKALHKGNIPHTVTSY